MHIYFGETFALEVNIFPFSLLNDLRVTEIVLLTHVN